MIIGSQEPARPDNAGRPGLGQIFGPIAADLQAVEACLAKALGGARDPALREVIAFLLGAPGKRIRPALVLLSARIAAGEAGDRNPPGSAPITVATAVELIHMASLVHDDLIDGAATRHHRASVNARWGAGTAVALGDLLCAHAMSMVCECRDSRVFEILGAELSRMCEGELLQVVGRADFSLSEQDCLSIIERKTAALFGACCEAGATVAAGGPHLRKALRRFGVCLGMTFQILDDCRDLLANEENLGKEPGQDLLAGDVTLPLLYGVYGSSSCGRRLRSSPRRGAESGGLTFARDAFRSSRARGRVRQVAEFYIHQARAQLDVPCDSDSKESLDRLTGHLAISLFDILRR